MKLQEGKAVKWEAVVEPAQRRITYLLPISRLNVSVYSSLAASTKETCAPQRCSAASPLSPESLLGDAACSWLMQQGYQPAGTATAEQVHRADVLYVRNAGVYRNCDGFYTDQAGLPLVIRTADCAAVFVVLPTVPAIGIAHAGWRGAAAGIIPQLVKAMAQRWNARPEDCWAAVAPHIRACCYEVGPEFKNHFPDVYLTQKNNRLHFDFSGFLAHQLGELGIPAGQFFISGECTACSSLLLYSYRRQQTAQRLVNVIRFQ